MKRKVGGILSFLFFVFILTFNSCMSDDHSFCDGGMTLTFSYTLNPEGKDYFGEEIDNLHLYLFDEDGYLVRAEKISCGLLMEEGGHLELSLLPGYYQAVAWGNLDEDVFNVVRSEDLSSSMRIELQLSNSGYMAEDTLNLYHGLTRFEVSPLRRKDAHVSFIRNTNRIHIVLENLPEEGFLEGGYEVKIRGENGAYYFDNSPVPGEPVYYNAIYSEIESEEGESLSAAFQILRLQKEYEVEIHFTLGEELLQVDNLIELLLGNFPELESNEDLDRYSEYQFVYRLDQLGYFTLVKIEAGPWVAMPGQNAGI